MNNQIKEKQILEAVVKVFDKSDDQEPQNNNPSLLTEASEDKDLTDITEVDLRKELLIEHPKNEKMYLRLKSRTPARLGIGKAGPRYKTATMLRIRADLAAARDAVQKMVSLEFIKALKLPVLKTQAEDKAQYLLRPDLGRIFDEENAKIMREQLKQNPDIQIVIGDGLSSTAIEVNIREILPALEQGLRSFGIDPGTPVFVKYSRVWAGDFIAETVGAKLVLILIGERPGVASSESMSCYMTYNPKVGMMESGRTVISNIHQHGTPPAEAGAHIAELVNTMLREKKSGVDLMVETQKTTVR